MKLCDRLQGLQPGLAIIKLVLALLLFRFSMAPNNSPLSSDTYCIFLIRAANLSIASLKRKCETFKSFPIASVGLPAAQSALWQAGNPELRKPRSGCPLTIRGHDR